MTSISVLSLVLDSIDSPRLLLNPDLTVAFANEAFVREFGRADYLGKPCHEIIFHRSKPCFECGQRCPLIETQTTLETAKILHSEVGPTGATHWELESTPVLGPDGRPQYYLESIVRRAGHLTPLTLKGIVARSLSVKALLKRIARVSTTNLPLLFLGPPGSGKREFARLVHENSRRASYDFITIECQGLTPEKLRQQFHLRSSDLLSSGGGTLYLSDISYLSNEMQSTLLSLLDTGAWTFKKGEAEEKIYANIRIICASSMSLTELEVLANLRLDFLLRFSLCPLYVPGLDDRTADIPELIQMVLQDLRNHGMNYGITDEAVKALQKRKQWRGHVTELQTILLRAAVFCDEINIDLADIAQAHEKESAKLKALQASEEERLNQLILSWKGSKRALAERLGLSERTIYRRLEKLTPHTLNEDPVSDLQTDNTDNASS